MAKGNYVDGFVLVIPKKNTAAYKKMAEVAGKVWKKHGALDYKECMAEDMTASMGVPFPKLTKAKPEENVWFSFIVYKSRKHRDQVNAKVMKDPAISGYSEKDMPFDIKRMAYGGFSVEVDY